MAWTTPRTWVDLEVLAAITLRQHLRDNMAALSLHTHSGAAGDGVGVSTIAFGSP